MPALWYHSVCYPQECARYLGDVSEVSTIASCFPGYANARRRRERDGMQCEEFLGSFSKINSLSR